MEEVSKCDAHYLLLKLCTGNRCILCEFRCIPGAISGVCGDVWRTPVPAGDDYGPVHPGGQHHLLEEALPSGRRYAFGDLLRFKIHWILSINN